jgi:hypothetical protein
MPIALYTISYRSTANVLAFCTLEQQELVDQAAWEGFRRKLVGDKLPLGLTAAAVEVPASDLAIDRIIDPPLAELAIDPYRYYIDVAAPGTAGDGSDKKLKAIAAGASVTNFEISKVAAKVTVKLSADATATPKLLFDGQVLDGEVVPTNKKQITFAVASTVTLVLGAHHELVFLLRGFPVSYQRTKVTA